VSPDGEILAWGQLYSSDPTGVYQYSLGQFVPNTNPWGLWKLNIAELILGEDPHLSNITSERVGNGNFYETQGWSSDSSRLIFASDIGKDHPYRIDIWSYSVRTKDLQHLINTQNNWEEMAAYSPDNKKISYMSSACCSWIPGENAIPFRETLATELYIMDSNLKNKRKLTAFNVDGLPSNSIFGEKKNIRAIVAGQEWSSNGESIYFEMPFYNKSDNKIAGSGLWKLEFEGNCGKK
ncbi:PD40 domain-containing protein, partial [Candidatus Dojkabacteria bacterium]|nr:PD40 domain-containing protein [Candidatus Dojkabacteria bacterium]